MLNNSLQPNETVLVHANRGVHYYRNHPGARIASIKPHILLSLSTGQFYGFIAKYKIRAAIFHINNSEKGKIFDYLEHHGFKWQGHASGDFVFILPHASIRAFEQAQKPGLMRVEV